MFKFKGISSEDMQVVIEEEEHFIARAAQRYEVTEIEGRDGALFDVLGYSCVERPIYVQCLNINKIDDILAWLNGEGEFEYKGRKTTARFYSQLEPCRNACIRIIDTTFIRDPFWIKANDEYETLNESRIITTDIAKEIVAEECENSIAKLNIKSGNSWQETREGVAGKTVEGEYITANDVELENGIIEVSGNDEQATRSGKNYFDASKIPSSTGIIVENNGKTIKMPIATGGNGGVITNKKLSELCPNLKVDDTVYLHFSRNLGIGNNIIYISGSSNAEWGTGVSKTITQNDLDGIVILYGNRYVSGETEQCILTDFRIVKNSDETFEPYGAMPSPEFPSEIRNCGDDVNLFDEETIFSSIQSTIKEDEFYKVNFSSLHSLYGPNTNGVDIEFKKDTQYVISLEGYITSEATHGNGGVFRFVYDDETYDNLAITSINTTQKYVLVSRKDKTITKLQITYGINPNNVIKNVKLQQGTVATPYSPYGCGTINIKKCNKNLCPTLIKNVKLSSVNGLEESNSKWATTDYIPVNFNKNSNYYVSGLVNTLSSFIAAYNSKKEFLGRTSGVGRSFILLNKNNLFEGGTPQGIGDVAYIRITQYEVTGVSAGTIDDIDNAQIQLEPGETATSYVEHEGQTHTIYTQKPFRKVDDTRDTFIKKNKWYERHYIKRKILDGNENWTVSGKSYYLGFSDKVSRTELTKGKMLCSHFKETAGIGTGMIQIGEFFENYYATGNRNVFFNYDNGVGGLEEWKAYLAEQYANGTPVYVDYILETPEDIECTEEQNEQLDELYNKPIYSPITNIVCLDEVKANLKLKYNYVFAMPSPDASSPIRNCGDDVNLFGATKNDFENGETLGAAKKVVFNLKPNTQYTCSSNDDTGTASATNVWFNGNDSSINGVFKGHSRTVVTDENGKLFIAIRTTQIEKFFDGTYYIKLQEGSIPTPYSPYNCGNINIEKRNKNILDLTKCTFQNCILNDDGSITSNINNSYYCNIKTTELNNFLFENKGKQITFSIGKSLPSTSIVIWGTRENGAKYQELSKSDESATMTISDDFIEITGLELRFNRSIVPFTDTTTTIPYAQFELGETATTYVEHQSQTITFPLAEGQVLHESDYLASDGIHQKRAQTVVNSKNMIILPNGNKGLVYNISNKIHKGNNTIISSRAIVNDTRQPGTVYENPANIVLIGTSEDTLETLQAKYNGSIVEYELAEEQIIPYTSEQQEVYDELQELLMYEDYTTVSCLDEIKPDLQLIYEKKLEIDVMNNGNIESRPIIKINKTTTDNIKLSVNDIQFKYTFPENENYVEIDSKEKTALYENLNRDRQLEIGYEFPKMIVGENRIKVNQGDAILEIKRKDRWL